MDWNLYPTTAGVAFALSLVALWELNKVRKHLHLDDLTPTRKWKKAFNGKKYVPNHAQDEISEHADDDARRFYNDFAGVAHYLNHLYEDTPWSFENSGQLETQYGESGAEREIIIRYNQQRTGSIDMSCVHYGHESFGDVRIDLSLINCRIFDGYEVFGLARSVTSIVTDTDEERLESEKNILWAAIDSMWQLGDESIGNPELKCRAKGHARWYLSTSCNLINRVVLNVNEILSSK